MSMPKINEVREILEDEYGFELCFCDYESRTGKISILIEDNHEYNFERQAGAAYAKILKTFECEGKINVTNCNDIDIQLWDEEIYVLYTYSRFRTFPTITMTHEGRYLRFTKEGDEKKEIRMDLTTGLFERINHYKTREDKITPTRSNNIKKWFSKCNINTNNEKFAKLFLVGKKKYEYGRSKSPVNMIQNIVSAECQRAEQWISLGFRLKKTEELFKGEYYSSYGDDSLIQHDVSEFKKETMDKIKAMHEAQKYISYRDINECFRYFNNGEEETKEEIVKYIEAHPEYAGLFTVVDIGWRNDIRTRRFLDENENVANLTRCINKYNLNIPALIRYINYLTHVESVDIYDLMSDYEDYLERELYIQKGKMSKMNKYPKTFWSTSKKQNKEYKNLKRLEEPETSNKVLANSEQHRDLEYADDRYLIKLPEDANDIRDEASQMQHCVAMYIPRIEANETTILLMRSVDDPDTSLVTVEVKHNTLTQAYAKNDNTPNIECALWLQQWAAKNNLSITANTII